jgi:hypothetical protein
VYLWTDQSCNGGGRGSRHFFRSLAQIAIEYKIPWLAAYLVDSEGTEPEELFPARDLTVINGKAPNILRYLLNLNPGYYRRAINRKNYMASATLQNESPETL